MSYLLFVRGMFFDATYTRLGIACVTLFLLLCKQYGALRDEYDSCLPSCVLSLADLTCRLQKGFLFSEK